ncbi:MAG: COX15/CtaA family protein [bacterium]
MALFNIPKKRKAGFKLALFATLFALVVVTLGAFTRLVDAGLGCPDWPGCYGHLLWPDEAHEIARAEELHPDSPVDTSKTWPEMVHRYFAGTLGLLIAALAYLGIKHHEFPTYPFRLPIFLLFLVVWQALFGMWTVTLNLWPQVVTLHLLGGMSIFALLWVLTLRLDDSRWQLSSTDSARAGKLKKWSVVGIVVLACQLILGGWTTSNYAAFGCPDFPTCHGSWWPPHMDFKSGFNLLQDVGPNYLGGLMENDARVAIHFSHRLGALVSSVVLVVISLKLFRFTKPAARKLAVALLVVLAFQIGLGISNVVFMVPLPVAVMHNAGGAILMAVLVTIAARLWMAKSVGSEDADD